MSSFEVIVGDALEVLRGMPSDSVHTCVTSPPYFGLRDYGTGQWEGGDAGCDHRRAADPNAIATSGLLGSKRNVGNALAGYGAICGKCGAKRIDNQIGLEASPEAFVAALVEVFREVRRVLRPDGTCWVNLGDSYANPGNHRNGEGEVRSLKTSKFHGGTAHLEQRRTTGTFEGLKPKDLIGIPWRVAFALQADGWWLRSDIIWHKPNPMPESVTDRPTKAHEYIFMLSKSSKYFYDADAIREPNTINPNWNYGSENYRRQITTDDLRVDKQHLVARSSGPGWAGMAPAGPGGNGRNKRTVWTVATAPFSEAHFATFPPKLIEPCILSGTSERGCCAECGAPWVRVVENSYTPHWKGGHRGKNAVGDANGMVDMSHMPRLQKHTETTGWKPTCRHSAGVVHCTVLDPFCGAGTTGLVAVQHGRRFVGVELNPEYAEMARRRIHNHGAPLFSWAASNSQELTA